MPKCVVKWCRNHSDRNKNTGITFHVFPQKPNRREPWIKAVQLERHESDWMPSKLSKICSMHFKDEDFYSSQKGFRLLNNTAIPICTTVFSSENSLPIISGTRQPDRRHITKVSEQEAQPGPSTTLSTRTSLNSNAPREKDPLSGTIEQCRFCGEFSKDCVSVSGSMPYLAANQTTLVLNHTRVQLDFNIHSLPSTVCRDCDAKLQEIADFLTVVKAAQDTLINVAEEREVGVEFEVVKPDVTEETETETLVIKTEYESQDEASDDEKEDKEAFVDRLTVSETIFDKKPASKRKSDAVTAKPKKLKAKQCDRELIIDIKEEVIETEDGQGQSVVSDSDVKPSELELATSALVFEIASEGTSEYQGYRSDR